MVQNLCGPDSLSDDLFQTDMSAWMMLDSCPASFHLKQAGNGHGPVEGQIWGRQVHLDTVEEHGDDEHEECCNQLNVDGVVVDVVEMLDASQLVHVDLVHSHDKLEMDPATDGVAADADDVEYDE